MWTVAVAALIAAACSSGSDADDEAGQSRGTAARAEQTIDTAPPPGTATVDTTIAPASTVTPAPTDTGVPDTGVPDDVDPPADGGRGLVWGVQSPDTLGDLDPTAAISFGEYAVLSQSFEHLTVMTDAGIVPNLATDWQTNDDATVWTFFLRDDVIFHDGLPLVAEDVAWSLNRAVEQGVAGISSAVVPDSVVVTDELTIELTTTAPNLEVPILVSSDAPGTAIVPDGIVPNPGFFIGTGPFSLTNYDSSDGADFVAFDEWWRGEPTSDTLRLQFFDRSDLMANALEAGEIDGVANVVPVSAPRLVANEDLTVGSSRARNHRQIWMRTDAGPFADVRVREAFALSIDRQALVDELWGSFGRVGNDHVIDSTNPGFDASLEQREKDDAAAAALLADAGFPDGLSATIYLPDLGEIPELAELVAEQASSAGFDFDVFILDTASFYELQWCPGITDPASDTPCGDNADIGIVDYGNRGIDSIFLSRPLLSTGDWNASNYIDPTYDELYNIWRSATAPDEAANGLVAIQQHLHADVPVVIPYFFDSIYAHRSDISVVNVSTLGQPLLARAEYE